MPETETPTRRRSNGTTALRTVGFVVAIVLGIVSIWLIATSTHSTRNQSIGALAGFWGLLIGAFAIFGRHLQQPAGSSSGVLDLRAEGTIERPEDAAARMEFELRLIQMLRREVQESMAAEMQRMREDVAALRSEIIEKVGGDLRMERIETTRIFGSDIEALQREIAALKGEAQRRQRIVEPDEPWTVAVVAPPTPVVEAEPVREPESERTLQTEPTPDPEAASVQESEQAAETDAQPEPEPTPDDESEPQGIAARTVDERPAAPSQSSAPAYSPPVYRVPITPPSDVPAVTAPVGTPVVQPPAPFTPPQPTPAEYAPAAAATNDERLSGLAGLPRLTPFTDFELDPAPDAPQSAVEPAAPFDLSTRAGRRRAAEAAEEAAAAAPAPASGGRRRREGEYADNDLLSRILQRERDS